MFLEYTLRFLLDKLIETILNNRQQINETLTKMSDLRAENEELKRQIAALSKQSSEKDQKINTSSHQLELHAEIADNQPHKKVLVAGKSGAESVGFSDRQSNERN